MRKLPPEYKRHFPTKEEIIAEAEQLAHAFEPPGNWYIVLAKNNQGKWASYGYAFLDLQRAKEFGANMQRWLADRGTRFEWKILVTTVARNILPE